MAVNLGLSYQEQNDSKALILTDVSTGITPNAIAIAKLDVTITKSDGTVSIKPQINLLAQGAFATQANMVYTITAAKLGDTVNSLLVDGLYALTYTLDANILNVVILVSGNVRTLVYQKIRSTSFLYNCTDKESVRLINEADLCGAYLNCIENSAYTAKTEELLNMLIELENLVLNGSNITW
jgi:hypothetical protein